MMRRRADLPPVEPQPWAALIPPESFYARLATYPTVDDALQALDAALAKWMREELGR